MEGIGIFIVIVIFAVVASLRSAAKKSEDAAKPTAKPTSQLPYVQPGRPVNAQATRPSNSVYRPNARLDSDKNYAVDSVNAQDAIDSYSMQQLGYERSMGLKRLSPEDMQRHREELKSLLNAGIISREEYYQKLNSLF